MAVLWSLGSTSSGAVRVSFAQGVGARPEIEDGAAFAAPPFVGVSFEEPSGFPTQVRWRWGAPPTDADLWQSFNLQLTLPVPQELYSSSSCRPVALYTQVRNSQGQLGPVQGDGVILDGGLQATVRATNPFIRDKVADFTPFSQAAPADTGNDGASDGDPAFTRLPAVYIEARGEGECSGLEDLAIGRDAASLTGPITIANNLFANVHPYLGLRTPGPYPLVVRVRDRAGNAADHSFTLTYDPVKPALLTAPTLEATPADPASPALMNLTFANVGVGDNLYPGGFWGVWVANSRTPVTDPLSSASLVWTPLKVERPGPSFTLPGWSLVKDLRPEERTAGDYYVYVRFLDGAGNPTDGYVSQRISLGEEACPASASSRPGDGCQALKSWTLMIYLAGDNDLVGNGSFTPLIEQIAKATRDGNPDLNLVTFVDLPGPGGASYQALLPSAEPVAIGEPSTGAPATLAEFVAWARALYPARHYALIMIDHGGALSGAMSDDSSKDLLDLKELRQSLATIYADGGKLDLLMMEACQMGMLEVGYQLRGYVDYYVASQADIWYDPGMERFYSYVHNLSAQLAPRDAARMFAESYARNMNSFAILKRLAPWTISAADLGNLDPLVAAVDQLAGALQAGLDDPARRARFRAGLAAAGAKVMRVEWQPGEGKPYTTEGSYNVDLHHLATLLGQELASEPEVVAAAEAVRAAVIDRPGQPGYIFYKSAHSNPLINYDPSHGVSIFLPQRPGCFYNGAENDFAGATTWTSWRDCNRLPGPRAAPEAASQGPVWGEMLVRYFELTMPEGPVMLEPHPPMAPRTISVTFLPLALR